MCISKVFYLLIFCIAVYIITVMMNRFLCRAVFLRETLFAKCAYSLQRLAAKQGLRTPSSWLYTHDKNASSEQTVMKSGFD